MRNSWLDLEDGEKHGKTCKARNAHCKTWNMARKLIYKENEKLTLQDLEYGETTDKRGKGETHMVGHVMW